MLRLKDHRRTGSLGFVHLEYGLDTRTDDPAIGSSGAFVFLTLRQIKPERDWLKNGRTKLINESKGCEMNNQPTKTLILLWLKGGSKRRRPKSFLKFEEEVTVLSWRIFCLLWFITNQLLPDFPRMKTGSPTWDDAADHHFRILQQRLMDKKDAQDLHPVYYEKQLVWVFFFERLSSPGQEPAAGFIISWGENLGAANRSHVI